MMNIFHPLHFSTLVKRKEKKEKPPTSYFSVIGDEKQLFLVASRGVLRYIDSAFLQLTSHPTLYVHIEKKQSQKGV